MTASRVISRHDELEGIGSRTHAEIDSYISTTESLVASSSNPIPPNARKLVAGSGILLEDNGAGNTLVVSLSGSSPAQQISWSEKPVGALDGVNTELLLNNNPIPSSSLMLFLNGVLQRQSPSGDYVITSGNIINFSFAPQIQSNAQSTYPFVPSTNVSWSEIPTGLNDGINMDFSLANTPVPLSSLMLFLNGILQKQGSQYDYVLSGSDIQFVTNYLSASTMIATYPY